MLHDLFVVQVPILEKIIRTVAVYALIVVLFRFTGKRGLAGLNTFDFIVIFLLSNVVQNAVIGEDNSLLGGAIGAATLVAVNAAVNRLVAGNARIAHLLEGRGLDVITDGKIDRAALRRIALRPAELDHAVRMQNGDDVSQIQTARLEPSGELVLTLEAGEQSATKNDIATLRAQLDEVMRRLAA